jgi:SAM-dependent methyltransferase
MQARFGAHDQMDLYGGGVACIDAAHARPIGVPPCPVCDAREARPRFAIEGLAAQVVVCDGCGLGRTHPLPSAAELAAFYPPEYYGDLGSKFRAPIELLVRLVGTRHVRFLASGLPRGGRVLDVGCGRGVVLGELADRGFEAHGVEISEAAARGADPRAEIRIAAELAAAGYPEAYFDGVIIWHVLEHLRDPGGTLRAVHRVLRPGGRLVVAVPNFASLQARWAGPAWFHLDLPRHLYHFPLSGLRRLLERHAFECVSEHHFSLRQNPFGWIQSWLNRRAGLPRNGLYTLLYQRGAGRERPFDPRTRARLVAGLAIAVLPALGLTLFESAVRSGGTIHLVCRR